MLGNHAVVAVVNCLLVLNGRRNGRGVIRKSTKLSLNKDAIRVLSSLELHAVVGGAALGNVPKAMTFTWHHCTAACDAKIAPARAVTTAAMLR